MTNNVGMGRAQQTTRVQASEMLQQVAGDLAGSLAGDLPAKDIAAVLTNLTRTQERLNGVYAALAAWHGETAGRKPPSSEVQSSGEYGMWISGELALQEAAQYGANVASALTRARHASQEAQWFHEESEG